MFTNVSRVRERGKKELYDFFLRKMTETGADRFLGACATGLGGTEQLPQEELDRILAEYATSFCKADENREQRIRRILANWHRKRVQLGFPAEVDHEHFHGPLCLGAARHHLHECTDHCSPNAHYPWHECDPRKCLSNMQLLDSETSLYGCIISGQHHFCASAVKPYCKLQQEPVGCKHSECAANWFIKEECRDTIVAKDASITCVYSGSVIQQWISLSAYEKGHKNKGKFMKDDGEGSTRSASSDGSPSINSGFLPQMTPKPKRTRRRPRGSPPDPARRLETIRNLEGKAIKIIWSLLFDSTPRKMVDESKRNKSLNHFIHKAELYGKFCKQRSAHPDCLDPAFWPVVMEIYAHEMQGCQPLPDTSPRSMDKTARHYAKMCVRLWKMMIKRDGLNCTFVQFVLGLLYMLSSGISKSGEEVCCCDQFLVKYLPSESDLEQFNYEGEPYKKNYITSGRNNINRAIANCPLEDLRRAADGEGWTNESYLQL